MAGQGHWGKAGAAQRVLFICKGEEGGMGKENETDPTSFSEM